MAEVQVRAVLVDSWWRRRPGLPVESIRLVRLVGADQEWWEVRRSGCDPAGYPNRSLALSAVAALIGDAWVHEPSRPRLVSL